MIEEEIGKILTGRKEELRQWEESEQSMLACPHTWGMGTVSTGYAERGLLEDKELERQIQTRPKALNATPNVHFSFYADRYRRPLRG